MKNTLDYKIIGDYKIELDHPDIRKFVVSVYEGDSLIEKRDYTSYTWARKRYNTLTAIESIEDCE